MMDLVSGSCHWMLLDEGCSFEVSLSSHICTIILLLTLFIGVVCRSRPLARSAVLIVSWVFYRLLFHLCNVGLCISM